MNQLDVKYVRKVNEDDGVYYEIEFIVDGRSFIEMIREFEAPFAKDLAGSYSNIFYKQYTEDFLLGRQPKCGSNHDKTELLGCACGCPGCWSFAVCIHVRNKTVRWEDFEQPDREGWNYEGFGPFVFDLNQYKAAMAKIPKN